MNQLVLDWIDKAEGDLDTALRELRARRRPNYDSACFHSQQMAEKYLKAWLQENDQPIPRIHNLAELVSLCVQRDQLFTLIENDLKGLDGYAIRVRYPGQNATRQEAVLAVKFARHIRVFIRNLLALPPIT